MVEIQSTTSEFPLINTSRRLAAPTYVNAVDFSLNIEPEDPKKFNDTNFSPRKVLTQALRQSQSGSLLKSQDARVKEAILGRRHHSLFENTLSVIEKTLNTEL